MHDKAVTFCSCKDIREYFVRDAVEGVVKILIAPASAGEQAGAVSSGR